MRRASSPEALPAIACLLLAGCAHAPRASSPPLGCFGADGNAQLQLRLDSPWASASAAYSVPDPAVLRAFERLPSCGGFDGLAPRAIVGLDSVTALDPSGMGVCTGATANASGTFGTLYSERPGELELTHLGFPGASDRPGGISTIVPSALVGGCAGTWTLSTFPVREREANLDEEPWTVFWSDDYLFQALVSEGSAPIAVVRHFRPAEGTVCPALGTASGDVECADAFVGRLQAMP